MTNKMKIKNLPKTIYLQIGEDCDHDDWNKIYPSHEVTWCEDKINNNDIVYRLDKRRLDEPKARSNGNAGYKEPADKWHFSGTILPEKNKAVLTYDPTEEDEREKFCVTYIYLDPKGRPHWDMHLDKLVWWRELPNKPEG